MKRGDHSHL
ncbi:hypothetical protein D039_4271A, partial [Vibrio parahaemolyticus EKP-028]